MNFFPGRQRGGGTDHADCAGLGQDPGALGEGGAGGADIVDEEDALSGGGWKGLIDVPDVFLPGFRALQAGLGRVIPDLFQTRPAAWASSWAWS